jgi:hypothetical protein
METFVILAYELTELNPKCYLVAVCDSQFIAQRYADSEAASTRGKFVCRVYKKLMNAPISDLDTLVYTTKSR